MGKKKGQAVFEFVIATVLFLAVVFYIINFLNATIYNYNSQFNNVILDSKSVQISEILVKDTGEWVGGVPVIVGLSDEYPVMDINKIQDLESYCATNYVDLIDNFNLGRRKFRINITVGGSDYMCGPSVPNVPRSETERFGILPDNSIVKLNVWVW